MRAIDFHVHLSTVEWMVDSLGPLREATERHFRTEVPIRTVDEMADEFRADDVLAVLLAWDAESAMGLPPLTNDFVADCVRRHPDAFVGFASVDPWKGKAARDELRRAVTDLGLRGLKLHPSCQGFAPNEHRFYDLYAVAVDLGVPVIFHTGTTGLGAGVPGGGGIKLGYSRPILLDDVAADFPELKIILAHPSFPWQEEALAVAVHKPNVYIDLSGWSPKYFPPQLVHYANTLLKHQVLFGSDYPMITPDRWLRDFERLEINPEVRPLILKDNAARLLGLGDGAERP